MFFDLLKAILDMVEYEPGIGLVHLVAVSYHLLKHGQAEDYSHVFSENTFQNLGNINVYIDFLIRRAKDILSKLTQL